MARGGMGRAGHDGGLASVLGPSVVWRKGKENGMWGLVEVLAVELVTVELVTVELVTVELVTVELVTVELLRVELLRV